MNRAVVPSVNVLNVIFCVCRPRSSAATSMPAIIAWKREIEARPEAVAPQYSRPAHARRNDTRSSISIDSVAGASAHYGSGVVLRLLAESGRVGRQIRRSLKGGRTRTSPTPVSTWAAFAAKLAPRELFSTFEIVFDLPPLWLLDRLPPSCDDAAVLRVRGVSGMRQSD
jgi:hypothetical protein